jgi:hypothetical protein
MLFTEKHPVRNHQIMTRQIRLLGDITAPAIARPPVLHAKSVTVQWDRTCYSQLRKRLSRPSGSRLEFLLCESKPLQYTSIPRTAVNRQRAGYVLSPFNPLPIWKPGEQPIPHLTPMTAMTIHSVTPRRTPALCKGTNHHSQCCAQNNKYPRPPHSQEPHKTF